MVDDNKMDKHINPGVSMNRPRYIVEFLFIIIIAFVYNWIMVKDGRVISFIGRTELNVKAKDVGNTFSDDAESFKIGVHRTDYVRVPLGFPLWQYGLRMYQYLTGQNAEVISVHKETSLVFDERLAHWDKYTEPVIPTVLADAIREQVDALMDKAALHPDFSELSSSLSETIKERRDDDVHVGGILISDYLSERGRKTSPSDGSTTGNSRIMVRRSGQVWVPEGFAPGYYVWFAYRYLTGQSTKIIDANPETDLFFDERIARKYSHLIEEAEAAEDATSHSETFDRSSTSSEKRKESYDDDIQVGVV